MVQKYNCKIGDRVYYENGMTGAPRTGIIDSEPDECGSVDLIEIGSMTPVRMNDTYIAWWNVTKIEDAIKNASIMRKIRKEASVYNITEEEYMRKIKMI